VAGEKEGVMLQSLFFAALLHLGWAHNPAPWVQQASPQAMVEMASRNAQRLSAALPGALRGVRPGFPGPLWEQAAKAHGVDPLLLYSIALLESGKKKGNRIGPWPYALHFNEAGVSIHAASLKEARFVLAHVTTENVDIGLGQVNYQSHKDKVHRPEDLLDPKINLSVASRILAEAQSSTLDPVLGVGRYHSRTPWRARAYGKKVLAIYRALKKVVEQHEAAARRQAPCG